MRRPAVGGVSATARAGARGGRVPRDGGGRGAGWRPALPPRRQGGKRKPAAPPAAKWRRWMAAPPAPRGCRALHAAITKWRTRRQQLAAAERSGARRRDAAPRSPESAALGRAAGATRSAASLGAVAERKSRSRLRREPALKGVGTGKPTRCSARAHAANRSPACESGSAPTRRNSQSEQSALPRGRAQAGHKLGWPVGCGWGHGVSSN